MWATITDDDCVHVVPCNEVEEVVGGHILARYCPCEPTVERKPGRRLLVIHDEPDIGPAVIYALN